MDNGFFWLVLLPASLFDLSRYRIPNGILFAGLIYSLFRRLELQGWNSVSPWLMGMLIPLFLYFILFRMRMFGASDGKLMAVVGSYVGASGVWGVMLYSLIVAFLLSCGKMLLHHTLKERVAGAVDYIRAVQVLKRPLPYRNRMIRDDDGVIPYGVAVCFGTLFYEVFHALDYNLLY